MPERLRLALTYPLRVSVAPVVGGSPRPPFASRSGSPPAAKRSSLRGREVCPSWRRRPKSNDALSSGDSQNDEHNTIFLPNFKSM